MGFFHFHAFLYFMHFARIINKIHLDVINEYFLVVFLIALFVKKLSQADNITIALHSYIPREKPEFSLADEIVVDVGAGNVHLIQNSGNYVTFSPEFSNKTIWEISNSINQIVYIRDS